MAGRRAAPIAVAVAGLVLLGAGQGVFNRHAIEDTLTTASVSALRAQGLAGTTVTFSGRDARIEVAGNAAEAARAAAIVNAVDGVRVATAGPLPTSAQAVDPVKVPPASSPQAPSARGIAPVGLTFDNGVLTVTGSVPSDAADAGVVASLAGSGRWAVVDRLQINAALPPASPDWISSLGGLAAAIPAGGARIVARFDGDRVIVRGTPATSALELDILAAAAGTVAGRSQVTDGLDVP